MVALRVRLSLLLLVGASLTFGQRAPVPAFAGVVLRNFDAWDRDHDGALTEAEVDRAALGPGAHGEDAAALAALHNFLAADKTPPRLTRAWFAAYQPVRFVPPSDAAAGESKAARRAYAATPGSLQSAFATDLRRLRKGGETALYAGEGPSLGDVRQGALGDCYMLAPLGALLHRDPEAVGRMFRPEGDGGYTVAFGDGKAVRVARPTDAEIAMGGSATANGLWVRLLEKAYGSRDFAPDEAEARIARDTMNGGNPAKAGRYYTGHGFTSTKLVGDYQKPTSDVDLAPRLETLRRDLTRSFVQRRLVLAATSKAAMPTSITGHHAYAVFGFDTATDTITLWNPHGNDFEPKGAEGVENGFRRKGGVFSMPLPDFARAFSRIWFEGDAPVAKG